MVRGARRVLKYKLNKEYILLIILGPERKKQYHCNSFLQTLFSKFCTCFSANEREKILRDARQCSSIIRNFMIGIFQENLSVSQ